MKLDVDPLGVMLVRGIEEDMTARDEERPSATFEEEAGRQAGSTSFGFAFDRRDHLIVSEAIASAASSYRFDERGPAACRSSRSRSVSTAR